MPDRLVNSVGGGGSAAVRAALPVVSRVFMIDLLAGGRPGELLSDHAAERQNRSIAIGLGECFPEMRQRNPLAEAGPTRLSSTDCIRSAATVLRQGGTAPVALRIQSSALFDTKAEQGWRQIGTSCEAPSLRLRRRLS
jgi:hypothetical protein